MKRFFYLSLMLAAALRVAAAEIFVVNQTGWTALYLYSYINNTNGIHGKWPGQTATRTEVINGLNCPVFSFNIPSPGPYFLIFNNGNGAQIKHDFPATDKRDYYLLVTTDSCREIQRSDIQPTLLPDPKPVVANDIIIYEANERVFASSRAFQAIDNRLPDIANLGVNVLWLMPIHPIGSKNSVGSPYCVRDYKAVHSSFGTLADLQTLISHAHDLGMRVIIDWVANHTAWDHPWVTAHPDWYTPAQTSDERNWNDVTFLDYQKPAVHEAMIDAMMYWVRQGIDGFRCDYAQGVPDDFWATAIDSIRSVNPNAIMLAETSRLELFEAGFDWMYSWNYLGQIQKLYPGNTTLSRLYSTHDSEMASTPDGKQRMRYITNHDACSERANSELYINADGMLSAACLTYFLGGIPLIYSSQEVGYLNKINFFSNVTINWSDNAAYQQKFQKLMKAYLDTKNLRGGLQKRYTNNADVACLTYTSNEGTLLVLANTKNASKTASIPEEIQGQTLYNLLTGQAETLQAGYNLPPLGCAVLSTNNTFDAIEDIVAPSTATKLFYNGQLIILNNGIRYTIMGQRLY